MTRHRDPGAMVANTCEAIPTAPARAISANMIFTRQSKPRLPLDEIVAVCEDMVRDGEMEAIVAGQMRTYRWKAWQAPGDQESAPGRKDLNQLAASIVLQATNPRTKQMPAPAKNLAAVALGRLGGLKGGKARDAALSAERKREIAKKAASARWGTPVELDD